MINLEYKDAQLELRLKAIGFQKEVSELMDKYQVELIGNDQYDGEDRYCGTEYQYKIGDYQKVYLEFDLDKRLILNYDSSYKK